MNDDWNQTDKVDEVAMNGALTDAIEQVQLQAARVCVVAFKGLESRCFVSSNVSQNWSIASK